VALLAPVWLQLVHLMLADCVWVTLVLTTASALGVVPEPAREDAGEPAAARP
jgi:cytochrome c oxidase assembly protein subunit 15/protoheme IX farnesyltransferase